VLNVVDFDEQRLRHAKDGDGPVPGPSHGREFAEEDERDGRVARRECRDQNHFFQYFLLSQLNLISNLTLILTLFFSSLLLQEKESFCLWFNGCFRFG